MTNLFNRWLPCLTLGAWSVIMLYFAGPPSGVAGKFIAAHTHLLSGRVDSLLVPAFRPYVLLAGVALLLMAVAFLLYPADAACCSAAQCGHPLSRFAAGRWLTFLVLLVPVSAAAFISPDSFGAGAMLNRGIISDASALGGSSKITRTAPDLPLPTNGSSSGGTSVVSGSPAPAPANTAAPAANNDNPYLHITPEGYIETEVLDLLYATQDPALRKDFEGKTVQLIAQLMPGDKAQGQAPRFKAVRMFMTCCAADARPIATVVEADKLPELPEMSWIRVIATATFPVENGRRTTVLKATKVEKTAPPEESMLY